MRGENKGKFGQNILYAHMVLLSNKTKVLKTIEANSVIAVDNRHLK